MAFVPITQIGKTNNSPRIRDSKFANRVSACVTTGGNVKNGLPSYQVSFALNSATVSKMGAKPKSRILVEYDPDTRRFALSVNERGQCSLAGGGITDMGGEARITIKPNMPLVEEKVPRMAARDIMEFEGRVEFSLPEVFYKPAAKPNKAKGLSFHSQQQLMGTNDEWQLAD